MPSHSFALCSHILLLPHFVLSLTYFSVCLPLLFLRYLSLFLYLVICLSLSLYLVYSSLSLCLFLFISLSLSIYFSFSVSFYLFLFFYLFISLSLSLYLFLSLSLLFYCFHNLLQTLRQLLPSTLMLITHTLRVPFLSFLSYFTPSKFPTP